MCRIWPPLPSSSSTLHWNAALCITTHLVDYGLLTASERIQTLDNLSPYHTTCTGSPQIPSLVVLSIIALPSHIDSSYLAPPGLSKKETLARSDLILDSV